MSDIAIQGSRRERRAWPARLARALVSRRLERLAHGRIRIVSSFGEDVFGRPCADFPREIRIEVAEPAFWLRVASGGMVSAGKSFALGEWATDDLVGLVRLFVRNRGVLESFGRGPSRLAAAGLKVLHWFNRNTNTGSRRNIAAHYDLGNDFFSGFLDSTMTYSAAVFNREGMSLEDAQTEKLDRLCRKLDLQPEHEVLEIGTGWGSFAMHAAAKYGCRVTTTTISAEQFALASERVAKAGLCGRVEVLQIDYRDLPRVLERRFDRLVSIEMIEAVGHKYLDTFFETCERLLRPDAMMAFQAITIADRFHDGALRSVDFIQRFVFPGAYIPSLTSMLGSLKRSTAFLVSDVEEIGLHYAETLRRWRTRFLARRDEYRQAGRSEDFLRLWEFYLAYCEGGFCERHIGTAQIVLTRPLALWNAPSGRMGDRQHA